MHFVLSTLTNSRFFQLSMCYQDLWRPLGVPLCTKTVHAAFRASHTYMQHERDTNGKSHTSCPPPLILSMSLLHCNSTCAVTATVLELACSVSIACACALRQALHHNGWNNENGWNLCVLLVHYLYTLRNNYSSSLLSLHYLLLTPVLCVLHTPDPCVVCFI